MTNEEIDKLVSIKIFGQKYHHPPHRWCERLDWAIDVLHEMFPGSDDFEIKIGKEVNEGFAGYYAELCGVLVRDEKSAARAVCLAALAVKEKYGKA